MKKFLFIFLIVVSLVFFVAQTQAIGYISELDEQLSATAGPDGAGYGPATDPRYVIANVIASVTGFMGIIFTAVAFYAGFLWLSSGGNEEKIGKARKIILYSSIGVLLCLGAFSITYFVSKALVTATTTYPVGGETLDVETGMVGSEFYTEPGLKNITGLNK